MSDAHFSRALFAFLRDLEANNEREWFKEHKDRYERSVKEPLLEFINDFAPRLKKLSKHFVADSRPVGGSMFRIHRDTRFSKDKTPYKTHAALQFRHEAAADAHAPGYYLHLSPGDCYVGLGLWRPETKVAYAIREHIDENQTKWKRAVNNTAFTETFDRSMDDSLVRPPRGYDEDHPLIDDLKLKSFTAGARVTQKQVTSDDFGEQLFQMWKTATPYMRFLCEATGVPF